jgi:ankyrin repeat protein
MTLAGNPAVVREIVLAGGDIKARDENGKTPLHWAAVNKYPLIAAELIKRGAEINARDKNGRTPLHIAANRSENPEVILLLVKRGADIAAKDNNGKTPRDNARRSEATGVIDFIRVLRALGGESG